MSPKVSVCVALAALSMLSLMTSRATAGPTNLTEFNIVRLQTKIYSVAGSTISFQFWSADISQPWNLSSIPWTDLSAVANTTTILNGYNEGVAFPTSDGTSLFAGAGNNGNSDDTFNLVMFSATTQSWSLPTIWGKRPAPRKLHAAEPGADGEIWFYGGEGTDPTNNNTWTYFNDFYRLFTATNLYDTPALESGGKPPGRYQHTMTAVQDKLFIMGGINCIQDTVSKSWSLLVAGFENVLVFDTVLLLWELSPTTGDLPASRTSHSAVAAPDGFSVVLYGGILTTNDFTVTSAIYVLDTCAMKWRYQQVNGTEIPPRGGHAAIRLGNLMLIMNGYGANRTYLNDAGIVDLANWVWLNSYTPPADLTAGWSAATANCSFVFSPQTLPNNTVPVGTTQMSTPIPQSTSSNGGGSNLFGLFALLALAGIPAYVIYRRRKRSRTPVPYWVPGSTSHELGAFPPTGGAGAGASATNNTDYPLFVYSPRPNTMKGGAEPAGANKTATPYRFDQDMDGPDEPVQDGVATQRHKKLWEQVRGLSEPDQEGWSYEDDQPLTGKANKQGWARLN